MIENYGDVLENRKKEENFGGAEIVSLDIFEDCEPVAYYEDYKIKHKGVFRKKKLTDAEREQIYDATRGVTFVCPLSKEHFFIPYWGEMFAEGEGKIINRKIGGLEGLILARVFERRQSEAEQANFRDCILTKDGTVIYKSGVLSVENTQEKILEDFDWDYEPSLRDGELLKRFYRNGTWDGVDGLLVRTCNYSTKKKLAKIYSQIAKYVAQTAVDECGIYKEEHEFETAKQLPAKIFTGNPEFVGEVLSGVEEILAKKLESVKEDDTEKIGKIVRFGERIGSELKKIFKGKIEEAKTMPQPNSYCTDTKSMFKEGTFDATELEALAKGSDKESNQAPRKK